MSPDEKRTSKIRLLDELTINQIAAGEVIENPSSVVKELVENSLDAGASSIHIEIAGGGRQKICISDDGCGMSFDDALLCLERHATSKIKNSEDVAALFTMGFRGEAIPSIASISKFTLITALAEKKEGSLEGGTIVFVEGGKIIKAEPCAKSPGTTIEVKNLFFNVPARRNFQKSPSHDSSDILKVVEQLSLANPDVKFTLLDQQIKKLHTPHSLFQKFEDKLKERIEHVLGKKYLSESSFLQIVETGFKLTGWIGLPTSSRPNKSGQYLFINKRAVTSTNIALAIKDGYSTSLPVNRYPTFVLHLEIDPGLVDVNVHPQKKEVRLRKEPYLKELIRKAVNKALDNYLVIDTSYEEKYGPKPAFQTPCFQPSSTSFFDSWSEACGIVDLQIASEPLPEKNQKPTESFPKTDQEESSQRHYLKQESFFGQNEQKKEDLKPLIELVGTIPGYILLEGRSLPWINDESLVVFLDQRAAFSRIIYESLEKQSQGEKLCIEPLIIPYQFDATKQESFFILQNLERLQKLGIGIREFGKESFTLDHLPVKLSDLSPKEFIEDLLGSIENSDLKAFVEGALEKKIAIAANRSSLKKQARLSSFEAKSLVEQLLKCRQPHFSPQGLPTAFSLKSLEIEKMMARGGSR